MAISFKKENYAKGELNANITDSDTSFTLKSGQGDLFPATGSGNQFAGVFWSANQNNPFDDVNREIVHCYRDSGDTFQVNTRGAESTSAKTWSMNDNFMLIASAAVFDDYETELDGKTAGPASSTDGNIALFDGTDGKTIKDAGKGVPTGVIVGTTDTQTLTNKTFDANGTGNSISNLEVEDLASSAINGGGSVLATEFSKSITIESPSASEDISMFFTNKAITITEMRAVLTGSSTPSVTWTIRHGTDRSATGAEVVTSGTTTTSVSTGSDVTSFNDASIVADSHVWVETTAQSGTVDSLAITIFYTID